MASIKCGYYRSSAENVDIPTKYFTHIIYAFLNPEASTCQFKIDDGQATRLRKFTADLHVKSPPEDDPVKVLFAVGSANDTEASHLSRMASDPASRAAFIASSIDVARNLGFDGVDLVWKYPQNPTEMENLGTLLEQWRSAVKAEADLTGQTALLLTAAVYYMTTITGPTNMTWSYPVSTMSTNLDFINVMTYDYHGSWEPKATGAFAALRERRRSVTDAGITSWTEALHEAQMPLQKLVMGLPLYGRTWTLLNPATSYGIGAPANGVGPGNNGVMTYAEVVQFNNDKAARVFYDDQNTVSVYSVAGSYWISYDDERSVREKVLYARGRGLGGYFFWEVSGDDNQWTISHNASETWRSVQEI